MAAVTTHIFRVYACCDTRNNALFQSIVNFSSSGIYTYSGPTYTDPLNGFEWVTGQCYKLINVGIGTVPSGAVLPSLSHQEGNCFNTTCPCNSDTKYLIFEKCCDGSLTYFKSTEDGGYLLGLKEYTGSPNYVLDNVCYRIDIVSVGIGPIVDLTMWNALPLAPNASEYTDLSGSNFTIDCTDPGFAAECPVCPERCFLLTKCDGTKLYTNTNLSLYLGQFININDQDNNPIPGDWYVIQIDAPCDPESYISSLQVTASDQPDCPNNCYEVTGTPTTIIYVDQDRVTHEILGAAKFCSIVPPIVMGGTGTVTNYGLCVDNECPELCYKFTNCITSETLTVVSNTPNISQYASQNNVVTLNGYDGCWQIKSNSNTNCTCLVVTIITEQGTITVNANAIGTYNDRNLFEFVINNITYYIWFDGFGNWYISESGYDTTGTVYVIGKGDEQCPEKPNLQYSDWSPEPVSGWISVETVKCVFTCDCPVNVTILQVFDDCPSCLPIIAYKFTNCNNQAIVKYSTDDYSAYVGKTVELDCGECWFVDQIDYMPPATQPITILYTFDSCLTCNRTYYKLTDCLDPNVNIVYTYSDLSSYLNQTVKIKGCDSCFTVTETREPINAGIVTVTDSFVDCPECLGTFPCVCTTITNDQLTEQTYCYIDCDVVQQTILLQPGETSDKLCVIKWIVCPVNDCNCILGTVNAISAIESNPGYTAYFNFLPTGEVYNDKPVYQDCYGITPPCNPPEVCYTLKYQTNGCWIASTGNIYCDPGNQPVFGYCGTEDCPKTTDWTYIPCTCVRLCLQTEQAEMCTTLYVTDYSRQYFTYLNGSGLEISFNEDLNVWEVLSDSVVIATASGLNPCSLDTPWSIVSGSYTSVNTSGCLKDGTYTFSTESCPTNCECLEFTFIAGPETYNFVWITTGETINGNPVYIGSYFDTTFEIYYDGSKWIMHDINSMPGSQFAVLESNLACPIGNWIIQSEGSKIDQIDSVLCEQTVASTLTTISNTDVLGYITSYGDCINNQCPVEPLPKRKVKPGYSTPSCDIEKYEKITCKSSEFYYKQVMRLRYGISNCCPEEEEKWLVKKELIDLDALRDPDYICQSVTTCCNQPISSCGCGCNTTLKTCNS